MKKIICLSLFSAFVLVNGMDLEGEGCLVDSDEYKIVIDDSPNNHGPKDIVLDYLGRPVTYTQFQKDVEQQLAEASRADNGDQVATLLSKHGQLIFAESKRQMLAQAEKDGNSNAAAAFKRTGVE